MHLLLLTDSFPNQNGAGISQTLYNLLSGWPHACTVLLPVGEHLAEAGRLPAAVLRYADGPWQPVRNRLGRWVNSWLLRKRLGWLQQHSDAQWLRLLPPMGESLVMVSTTVPEKLLLARRLQQGHPSPAVHAGSQAMPGDSQSGAGCTVGR